MGERGARSFSQGYSRRPQIVYTNCTTHKCDSSARPRRVASRWQGIIERAEKAIAALVRFIVYAPLLRSLTTAEFNDRR